MDKRPDTFDTQFGKPVSKPMGTGQPAKNEPIELESVKTDSPFVDIESSEPEIKSSELKLDKSEYEGNMEQRLKEIGAKIDKAYAFQQEKACELKEKYEQASKKFNEVKSASGEAFHEIREGMDKAFEELKKAFDELKCATEKAASKFENKSE